MKYENDNYFGFLLIDKPKGASSHDVVADIRRRLGCKVGHTGTLDPFATGLLIIALGKATRLAEFLQKQDKEYTVRMVLGEEKDSYDVTGESLGVSDYSQITEEDVLNSIKKFRGNILQSPPAYSAIKVNGKRAYELARKGEVVKLKERPITINSIEVTEFVLPEIELKISCSTGTYIRSIVHDIGVDLGCFAYAKELRRKFIRGLSVEQAVTLPEFLTLSDEDIRKSMIHPVKILDFMPKIDLTDSQFEEIKHGRSFEMLENSVLFEMGMAVYGGELASLIKVIKENGQIIVQPEKVFITANSKI